MKVMQTAKRLDKTLAIVHSMLYSISCRDLTQQGICLPQDETLDPKLQKAGDSKEGSGSLPKAYPQQGQACSLGE